MGIYLRRLLLTATTLLAACGSGAPFDDTAMFRQSFGNPVIIQAPITSADENQLTCAVAQSFQSGRFRYEPMTEREPYITLVSTDNSISGDQIVLFRGQREFNSSSDEQRYSRNASDYFAQTVTYFIRDPSSPLTAANAAGFGPFSVRLVYVNDPAVGSWRLETFTPVSGGEAAGSDQGAVLAILSDVAQRGCPTQVMRAAADAARTEAMNRIERQMAEAGLLVRGPVPNTVVSRQNRRIWFTGAIETTDKRWRDMFPLCRGVRVAAGTNWRPPSFADLRTLMRPVPNGNNVGILIDTPDRRFFGAVIHPRGQIRLAMTDLLNYNGTPTTFAQAESRRAVYQTWVYKRNYDQAEYRPDLSLTWDPGDYPLQGAVLLCVADYST